MSSKRSGGTIRCRMPFLVQIEQLQIVTLSRSAVTRKRTRPQWHPPCIDRMALLVVILREQPELRRVARRLDQAEVLEGQRGDEAAARRALEQALLDQEWLDDLLDGVARLGQRRRQRLDADRAAGVVLGDGREITAVH